MRYGVVVKAQSRSAVALGHQPAGWNGGPLPSSLRELPAAAVTAFRAQRSSQLQERLLAGSRWQESGLVFTSNIGTPMMPGDLTKRVQRLLAEAGLPRLRYHDLRHGTASLLTAQGIHPRTIMEILGHSTIAVTMNSYAHVAPVQREAASSLDAVLGSA